MENEAVWNETEMNDAAVNENEATVGEQTAEETDREEKSGIREDFSNRYQAAQKACKSTLERLARDLKEANGNPYIRATSSFRYDIYRTANDEEPIDTFVFEKTNGCTLRALALAASLLAAANIAIKTHFGK